MSKQEFLDYMEFRTTARTYMGGLNNVQFGARVIVVYPNNPNLDAICDLDNCEGGQEILFSIQEGSITGISASSSD